MKEEIKNSRVQVDGLAQLAKSLYTQTDPLKNASWVIYSTREVIKSVDSLYLAKAWLGKVLGELGEANPYGSGYKTKEDIVLTQDRFKVPQLIQVGDNKTFTELNHIEKVDWLRQEIAKVQKEIHNVSDCGTHISGLLAWKFIYQHLCEARFWLGFELGRIKLENN